MKRVALVSLVLLGVLGAGIVGRHVSAIDGWGDAGNPGGLYYGGNIPDGAQYNPGYAGPMPEASNFSSGQGTFASGSTSYRVGRAPQTQYGIKYSLWHCPAIGAAHFTYPNLPDPVSWFWHGMPTLGYYCNDAHVMAVHAAQLRDAGIDFVYLDVTNWSDVTDPMTELSVMAPFRTMLATWAEIPGAPKIVPMIPLPAGGSLLFWFDQIMHDEKYSNLLFGFKGKPLMLAWKNMDWVPDPGAIAQYSQRWTIRTITGVPKEADTWVWMSWCQNGFKATGGQGRCGQPVGFDENGIFEQVPAATAYQYNFMTADDAVPKFGGRTFHSQMARMDEDDVKDPPIVTIEGWNEWIAMRFCYKDGMQVTCDTPGSQKDLPNGRPVVVDLFDGEYNRDIEPGTSYGDVYYKQLISEVLGRKQARTAVIGYVDLASTKEDGTGVVAGWACSSGYTVPINVEVYANGPAGVGELVSTAVANVKNEEGVAKMCQDGWQGMHRFEALIPAATMSRIGAQTVYVRGLSPVGKENFMIANSGVMNFSGSITSMQVASTTSTKGLIPVYRFRSGDGARHFYSANYAEGIGGGFISEGTVFYLKPTAAAGLGPVYRCYDGNTFLSGNGGCGAARNDGLMGYANIGPAGALTRVFDLRRPTTGDQLLTLNGQEWTAAQALGYQPSTPLGLNMYVDPSL